METSTFLWIGGIAVIAILGVYTIKASKKKREETNNHHSSQIAGQIGGSTQMRNPGMPQKPVDKPGNTTSQNPLNQMAAKNAFLSNIKRFVPKLNSLLDGTYDDSDWTDDIIDINDPDLIEYWKKIYKDSKAVLRVLSGWGVKPEMCTSFVSMDTHKSMYTKADGTSIDIGKNYNVIKKCWILTNTNSEGKVSKTIIVKGEVV